MPHRTARLWRTLARAREGRRGAAVGALAIGLGLVAACGTTKRPPALSDDPEPIDASTEDAGGGTLSMSGSEEPPMCNLGPDGGVCACADQPLLTDVPNLYFILDRSGSMSEDNKWGTIQEVLTNVVVGLGPRANVGAAVFPASNASDSCSAGNEVFPPTPGDSPAGQIGSTGRALFSVLGRIPAEGGTPTAATLSALTSRVTSLSGRTFVILATDGGPNCNPSVACSADLCQANIESAPDCPPGGPPDCCTDPNFASLGGNLSCLDSQATIQAVSVIAAAGVPVYVIGVPGSAPYADLLDQLAQTGGTARGSEPQYYAVNSTDESAFTTAIGAIAAKITGNCVLQLDAVPPDGSLVNVFLDEQAVPQSGQDGWTLTGTTVTLLGASCQAVLNGTVLDVRVVAGCPTVVQ